MKKIYISTFALFFSLTALNAQSFQVLNVEQTPNVVMANNDVIINETQPGRTATHHFLMKNTGATSQTIAVRKTIVQINTVGMDDEARAYFCTGVDCYDASVMNVSFEMASGDTMTFTADLDEATVAGTSEVNYKFSAIAPGSTNTVSINFNLKYNASPVGLTKLSGILSGVSQVFPNPTSAGAAINITSDRDVSGVQVSIINSLGARVSSKQVNLNNGKNTIDLDTDKLNSGVYFISIRQGETVVTKKLTVLN